MNLDIRSMLSVTVPCFLLFFVLASWPVQADEECTMSSGDSLSASVKACKSEERAFLKDMAKSNRKKSSCQKYYRFRDYFMPLHRQCPHLVRGLERKWRKVIHDFDCMCNPDTVCESDFHCFKKHFAGELGSTCDDLLEFNLKQHNYDSHQRCVLIKQNVHCKEALVSTACGQTMGHLAHIVAKYKQRKHLQAAGCSVPHINIDTHTGFKYDKTRCPTNLQDKAHDCEASLIDLEGDSEVRFLPGNDLIVAHSSELPDACRRFKSYQQCMSDLEQDCPQGMKRLSQNNDNLRTYSIKMEYICNTPEYSANLECYTQTEQEGRLQKCAKLWLDNILDFQKSVSAVKFFCHHSDPDASSLRKRLKEVKDCYEEEYKKCSDEAGRVMGQLVHRAFQDKYYLRYKFKPDCHLHARIRNRTVEPVHHPVTNSPLITTRGRASPRAGNLPSEVSSTPGVSPTPKVWTKSQGNEVTKRELNAPLKASSAHGIHRKDTATVLCVLAFTWTITAWVLSLTR